MAAGLAAGGMRPYFAVYSSFFQSCYDQMIHDVSMQHLPVVFLLDRSGIGGEDGQTHHGVFDFAAVLPVPGMTVLSPCDANELCEMIRWTATQDGPVTIRYGKDGCCISGKENTYGTFVPGEWKTVRHGKDLILLATGGMVKTAAAVSEMLCSEGVEAGVVNCSSIKPLDEKYLKQMEPSVPFFTLEEHMVTGGFGEYVAEKCRMLGITGPADCIGVPDRFIPHGSHGRLLEEAGLSPEKIHGRIQEALGRKKR
jgi:1-deoxy-D-xylulose-5-phosphate synthase